jgi:hypothetical protein
MKKILIILAILSFSCKKETPQQPPTITQPKEKCNCGVIVSHLHLQLPGQPTSESRYTIKNDCTNNTKTFDSHLTSGLVRHQDIGTKWCSQDEKLVW